LLVAVAKWALPKLKQKGKLPLGKLIRRNGQMRQPGDVGEGWKVETKYNAKDCVRNAIYILKEVGEPVDQVFVTLQKGQRKQESKQRRR
jgi:hypothetical protein